MPEMMGNNPGFCSEFSKPDGYGAMGLEFTYDTSANNDKYILVAGQWDLGTKSSRWFLNID